MATLGFDEARVGSSREMNVKRQESRWCGRITVEVQGLEELSSSVRVNALLPARASALSDLEIGVHEYQPLGVSPRFKPDANAFRLIEPNTNLSFDKALVPMRFKSRVPYLERRSP